MCTRFLKNDARYSLKAVPFFDVFIQYQFYLNCNCFLSYSILIFSSINRRRLIFFHYFSFLLLVGPAATTTPPQSEILFHILLSSLSICRTVSSLTSARNKRLSSSIEEEEDWKRLNDVWRGWDWRIDPLKITKKKRRNSFEISLLNSNSLFFFSFLFFLF